MCESFILDLSGFRHVRTLGIPQEHPISPMAVPPTRCTPAGCLSWTTWCWGCTAQTTPARLPFVEGRTPPPASAVAWGQALQPRAGGMPWVRVEHFRPPRGRFFGVGSVLSHPPALWGGGRVTGGSENGHSQGKFKFQFQFNVPGPPPDVLMRGGIPQKRCTTSPSGLNIWPDSGCEQALCACNSGLRSVYTGQLDSGQDGPPPTVLCLCRPYAGALIDVSDG